MAAVYQMIVLITAWRSEFTHLLKFTRSYINACYIELLSRVSEAFSSEDDRPADAGKHCRAHTGSIVRALLTFSTGVKESAAFLRVRPAAFDQVQTVQTSLRVKVNLSPVLAPQRGSEVCFDVSLWTTETKK